MGKSCQDENLTALVEGSALATGRIFYTDKGAMGKLQDEIGILGRPLVEMQRAVIGLTEGAKPKYIDMIEAEKANKAGLKASAPIKALMGGNWDNAKAYFPEKFFNPIEKTVKGWEANNKDILNPDGTAQKGKQAEALKRWKDEIGDDFQTAITDVVLLSKESLTPKQFNDAIKEAYGLSNGPLPTQRAVMHGLEYLQWLADGAHFQYKTGEGEVERGVGKVLGNLMASRGRNNPTWIIGNLVDMGRVSAVPLSQGKPLAMFKALAKTFAGGATSRQKELEGKGIYDLETDAGREELGDDAFAQSVYMQKNYAYHLDKELGGDGKGLLETHVFESRPWTQAPAYRDSTKGFNNGMRLMRFVVAETRYFQRMTYDAVNWTNPQKAVQATGEMLAYMIPRALVFGVSAVIPHEVEYLIEQGMGKEDWGKIKTALNDLPFINVGGKIIQGGVNATAQVLGAESQKVDVGKFLQPGILLNPKIGYALTQIGGTLESVGKRAVSSAKNTAEGKYGEATLNALAGTMAVLNMTPYRMGNLNSALTTKLLNGWADAFGEEQGFDGDKSYKNTLKAIFGGQSVSKEDSQNGKGGGRMRRERPQRRKRMQRQGGR